MIVPAQNFAVEAMKWPLMISGAREQQLLWRRDFLEIVLRAIEMRFVSISVPTRAGIGGHLDPFQRLFGVADRRLLVVRIDQKIEVRRHMLTLLRQHVVDM